MLLVACQGETRTVRVPVGPEQSALDVLAAAVAAVDERRAGALEAAGAVPAAAIALDAADEAGATGQARLAADASGRAWPAYAGLGQVQATWLERAQAGWYRTTAEAAAYTVLRRPQVAELEQARVLLQSADAARRPATGAMRRELAEADAALDGLRGPAG